MNSIVIILGILIIFLIYLLVVYLTSKSYVLGTQYNFTNVIMPIAGDNLPQASNVSYAYGIWLYVQNWDPNSQKTILYRQSNLKLYLDRKTPVLYCDMTLSDGSTKTVMITNSFALQRWVCIILSVDGQYLDCYLDGKLVISYQIITVNKTNGTTISVPMQPTDSNTAPLYLGNSATPNFKASATGGATGSGWSATANAVTRWVTPVDPQTAWNWYMKGNGQSTTGMASSYKINYSILKDNIAIVNNKPLF